MTKIEVLVVLLVIGVLGLVSGVAVLGARERVRDTARLAQVRELQDGLESFFTDHSAYPEWPDATDSTPEEGALPLGQATTLCLSDEGFSCTTAPDDAYLDVVPTPPTTGLRELSSCRGVANAYCYQSNGETYGIQFELERANAALGLVKGANCASEATFSPGPCADVE